MASKQNYSQDTFLAELESYVQEQRELIESECTSFKPGATARASRILQAQKDYEFFAQTYFPHYLLREKSAFHEWAFKNIPLIVDSPDGELVAIAAPRGEAKSTLITQIVSLWIIVTNRSHIIPIVMDTSEQAQTMLADIKAELEFNPRLRSDFPKACGAGRVWNVNVILTNNNIKLKAFGKGKRMRGLRHGPFRPQIVMLDDLDNDENVQSKEQRDKDFNWIVKVVLPLGPPEGTLKVLFVHTLLHHDSPANRLHNNPAWQSVKFSAIMRWPDRMDLWDIWEGIYFAEGKQESDNYYRQNKAAMDEGSMVSWPSTRPLLMLMKIRAADHHAFNCEYQNDPSNGEFSPFGNFEYWVQPSRDWVFFGSHDPSLGKTNKRNDPSASLVGGYDREKGVLCVVEAKIARIKPNIQIAQLINLQEEYQCMVWAMETIQFQEFFADSVVEDSAKQHMHVPIQPVVPNSDKTLRILALQPFVEKGSIQFHRNLITLLEMLKHFPDHDHDDGPDALEMLWQISRSWMRRVDSIKTGKLNGSDKHNCGL